MLPRHHRYHHRYRGAIVIATTMNHRLHRKNREPSMMKKKAKKKIPQRKAKAERRQNS